jgi:hypothetical protein
MHCARTFSPGTVIVARVVTTVCDGCDCLHMLVNRVRTVFIAQRCLTRIHTHDMHSVNMCKLRVGVCRWTRFGIVYDCDWFFSRDGTHSTFCDPVDRLRLAGDQRFSPVNSL